MAFNPNYGLMSQGSANLANATANLGQQLGGGLQALGQGYALGEQREQQAVQQSQLQELVRAAMSGNQEALSQLNGINPELGMEIQDRLSGQLQKNTIEAVQRLYKASPEDQPVLLEQMIADPSFDIDEADIPYINDENIIRAGLTDYYGKDYADAFFGGDSGTDSLPAEAAAFNDLIKDMTPEQQKTAKLIKAGLKGRAITNAEMTAIQDGTIDSYGQWKTEQKQKEKFAEATGANRAKIIDQGFDKINKADVALRNIDKAVAALDKGAGVGAVEKLWPSITAASVELDNIRGQMALDVVGAVTFGALSEGELNLAKDVALPTGLDTNQLKDYLARKKAAQQKLRAYYYDQIQHLDQGGTVASFLRSKKREQQPESDDQAANQDEQALQWANANPNDPRAAAILQKLGVQ